MSWSEAFVRACKVSSRSRANPRPAVPVAGSVEGGRLAIKKGRRRPRSPLPAPSLIVIPARCPISWRARAAPAPLSRRPRPPARLLQGVPGATGSPSPSPPAPPCTAIPPGRSGAFAVPAGRRVSGALPRRFVGRSRYAGRRALRASHRRGEAGPAGGAAVPVGARGAVRSTRSR